MAIANMQVYQEEIYSTTIELLGQNLDAFNAASGGTIILSAESFRGDYNKEAFYQQISSLQRRVDRYAANGAVAATDLAQAEHVGVKVAGGFGPVLFEEGQLTWLQRDPGEAITVIAEGFADALLADQLNTGVLAAVAAVENNSALVSAEAGGVTQRGLNRSYALFGDMSSMINSSVMTGSVYHRLIDEAIANANQLFVSSNVLVVDIQGKLFVVSDIPALYEAGAPNKDKVLSLVTQGLVVDNATDIITNMENENGNERISTTFQADYTFGVKIKGYSWDVTNGGASPDDAALSTGTNWDKDVVEDKHTAGVLLTADADA